jgi:hypothetical protein
VPTLFKCASPKSLLRLKANYYTSSTHHHRINITIPRGKNGNLMRRSGTKKINK